MNNTKTSLFKYTEKFTTKNENFQIKKIVIFHVSLKNIDCGYLLDPCKPQFYYIKVGFKGSKVLVYRYVFVMRLFTNDYFYCTLRFS